MIGVLDSGVGGFNSAKELMRLLPRCDIAYFADRKNAPYGTKNEDELISLVSRGIDRLSELGAEKILLACCTASTLWKKLDPRRKELSRPIIRWGISSLTGEENRVLVIATEHTVRSGAFSRAIHEKFPEISVYSEPMQSLVSAVERGARGNLSDSVAPEMEKLVKLCKVYEPDSLVLGCTHFSTVENEIKWHLPHVKIINPAILGAKALAQEVCAVRECGRVIYTE
jgi:glutamate racemase